MRIETLNHDDEAVRQRVFAFLAPHEAFGLFILGNPNTHFPGTHLCAAAEGQRCYAGMGFQSTGDFIVARLGCPLAQRGEP